MKKIDFLRDLLATLATPEHFLFCASDFSAVLPNETKSNMMMILSRLVSKGYLVRVCKGIYIYPKVKYDWSLVLYKVALKLRSDVFCYLSLESVLSEAAVISQQMPGWICVMTKGRKGIIECGKFGTIEFVHTQKDAEKVLPHISFDRRISMWRADVPLALAEMKAAKRSLDLVNSGMMAEAL